MPDLLHTTERDRLLASLRRMLREVRVDGQGLAGLARSEAHGAPLLTADNALAAEAMAIPALPGVAAEPNPSTPALAVVLRGLRAVEMLAETGRMAVDASMLSHARAVMAACLDLLSSRLRNHADRLEVLPAQGNQADALSQAALLLAVLSPDETALSLGGVAA
jgi:hypothetical protein